MTLIHPDRRRAAEDAAQWVVRLQWESSPSAQAEFDSWVRRGPMYLEEFLLARAAFEDLKQINSGLRFDAGNAEEAQVVSFPSSGADGKQRAILHDEVPPASPMLPAAALDEEAGEGLESPRKVFPRKLMWPAALAACLSLALLAGSLFVFWPLGTQKYSTRVGSQQTVKLRDGSIIALNTNSEVEVHLSDQLRSIHLVRGEALFTVAHDTARPFVVKAGRARVRAVGTAFNVRTSASATRVAVIEGVVQVTRDGSSTPKTSISSETAEGRGDGSPAGDLGKIETSVLRLEAGDEAEVNDKRAVKIAEPNVQTALAWRSRKLVFAGERADEIAAEFNRYNAVKIRIEGEILRAQRMGGTFDADDPKPLVRYLSRNPEVEVVTTESLIIIRSRKSNTFEAKIH